MSTKKTFYDLTYPGLLPKQGKVIVVGHSSIGDQHYKNLYLKSQRPMTQREELELLEQEIQSLLNQLEKKQSRWEYLNTTIKNQEDEDNSI